MALRAGGARQGRVRAGGISQQHGDHGAGLRAERLRQCRAAVGGGLCGRGHAALQRAVGDHAQSFRRAGGAPPLAGHRSQHRHQPADRGYRVGVAAAAAEHRSAQARHADGALHGQHCTAHGADLRRGHLRCPLGAGYFRHLVAGQYRPAGGGAADSRGGGAGLRAARHPDGGAVPDVCDAGGSSQLCDGQGHGRQ